MERPDAVLALGASLLDYLPAARQPSSTIEAVAGLARSRRVPCASCGSRGRLGKQGPCAICPPRAGEKSLQHSGPAHATQHGCRLCLVCDGWGWRRARPGDAHYDEYARVEVGEKAQQTAARRDDLGRRLARTERLLREWEGDQSLGYAWEEKQRRQFRQGDYRALLNALEALRQRFPRRYATWWRFVVTHDDAVQGPALTAEIAETTRLLAYQYMPEREIRVPTHLDPVNQAAARKHSLWRGQTPAHARQRAERDELIRKQRYEQEWKISRIARYHALSERQVKNILYRPVATAA